MGLVRTSTESFTHALENNKLSMGQYFRYAGGATKTFGRMFKNEFDTIGRVAEERVKKMQTQYIKMGRDANGATRAMSVTPLALNMKDVATQTALAAQKQALFNQLVRQGSTNLLNFGKNTQWAGRQLMVGFSVPLAYIGSFAAKTFMDMELQAVRFKRVYGDMFTTSAETNKALEDIQKLAEGFTKYGVAVVDTMKMAADAAATGKQGAELTAQVSEATRLAVLGGVDQQKALETTISLTNAFGISAQDLKKNVDFLNAVENQTVTNIEDLTIAIPKAAPVIKQLGGNVQDLAFFLTAMKEGGVNASEGANAIKSGLAALINPTKKASDMLAGFGINVKGIVEGDKGNLKKTVVDFAMALNTLDPLNRARAIEQMFGKFQFARLSTLFQNITKDGTQANRVLDLTAASVEELAILSEREMKTVQDAVGTNFKASIQELKLAIAPIGKTFLQAITPVVKAIGNLFEKFNGLSDGTKKFVVVATTLVGVVGPVLLMTFGLLANGVANIIKLFLALRVGFLKMTGDSKNLGATTEYLTAAQLESETVAASLSQAHTRLTQQFELESTAVMALRNAYVQATVAATAFARANPGMMAGGKALPKGGVKNIPFTYAKGTSGVPGYAQGTDTVPAMLTPGEAVIPVKTAQDPQFKPLIKALVTGNIQRYQDGTVFAHATDKKVVKGSELPADLAAQGYKKANAYTAFGFDIPDELHKALTDNRANVREYEAALRDPLATKTMTARLIDQGFSAVEAKRTVNRIRTNLIKSLMPLPDDRLIGDRDVYSRVGNAKTGILGGLVRDSGNGVVSQAIKELIAPAAYSPTGKSSVPLNTQKSIDQVIEAVRATNTNKSIIKVLEGIKTLDPNKQLDVSVDKDGKIIAYERPEISGKTGQFNGRKNLGVLVGDKFLAGRNDSSGGGRKITTGAKSARLAAQTLEGLTASDLAGREVAQYGKQLSQSSGFSFKEASHIGGVYETLDGNKVFVKPMMDERAALAEQRATQIARDAHGLESPKQTLRVIKDPFTGEKLFALESPFDPKFAETSMTGKFTQDQYFRQLVAANLRGDKDLHGGNLSGNVLADVGTAGVFDKASGQREFSKNMKSMAEQARINLLGVKGGAKRFFAESTLGVPQSMTADAYHAAMITEIDKVLPKLKKTVSSFNLNPEERVMYQGMIDRLEEGRKVDWREFHKIHSSVVVTKKESLQDTKTGKVTPIKGKPKPSNVTPSSGNPFDNILTTVPKGKAVVQTPKTMPKGKIILPGLSNAPVPANVADPFASTSTVAAETRASEATIKQSNAVKALTAETVVATTATKTMATRLTGASGAFAGLTILGSFMGGKIGEVSQKLLPLAIGLQVILQMLPSLKTGFMKLANVNPWILALAAVVTVAATMYKFNKDMEKAGKEGVALGNSMSMTTDKLIEMSKITTKVSATESADKRRQDSLAGTDAVSRKFGTTYLQSDIGKQLSNSIGTMSKSGQSITQIGNNIANQLAFAIAQGAINTDQAKSIASALGEQLKSYEIPAIISGKLVRLLGVNGENLLTDPLTVTLAIQKESIATQLSSFEAAINGIQKNNQIKAMQYEPLNPISNYIGSKGLNEQNARLGSAAIQMGINQVKQNGDLLDSINKQYDAKVAIATTDAEIATIEEKRKAALDTLNKENDKYLKTLLQQKDSIGVKNFDTAIASSVTELYKNATDSAKTFADQALKSLEGLKDSKFKTSLQLQFASGSLDALTVSRLIDLSAKDKTIVSNFDLMVSTQGTEQANSIIQMLMKANANNTTVSVVLDFITKKDQQDQFNKNMEAINIIANQQQKYGINVDINTSGIQEIENVKSMLNTLGLIKGTDITKKTIETDLVKADPLTWQPILDNWTALVGTKSTITKTMILDLVSGKIDQNVWNAYQTAMGIKPLPGGISLQPSAADMAKANAWRVGVPGADKKVDKFGNPIKTNTGNRDTTLDNLLNRLKMIRDASINAVGGVNELKRITAGAGIEKFSGVINQLMTGAGGATGKNRDFISFIESMDDATRKAYLSVDKLGKVTLKPIGKDLAEAFNEQTLGNFNTAQLDTVTATLAQQSAFIKLKAAGVDSATALSMVADAQLAISINSSVEPANQLKNMAIQAKKAADAVTNLNLAFKQTMQTSMSELEMLKKLPDLVDEMNALGLNTDQVQAVLNNPDFAREMLNNLKDGKIISQDLADYLASIPERKQIEIDIAMKTPQGMQGLFDKAMGNAQEYFNTLEAAIQIKFKQPMKDAQAEVDKAKVALQEAQASIDGLQASIDTKQRNIETNITRVIENYQADIDALQATITAQFDKPIAVLGEESSKLSHDLSLMDHTTASINDKYDVQSKALTEIATLNSEIAAQQKQQLTLADALTQGDISAAAAAAQDMRATEVANQTSKQQATLTAAKDLEIANLRNAAGQTRAQIEERQYAISEQTYAIEQQRKIIQDQIAAIQETKIAPLEAQKLIAQREIRDLEDKIYAIQIGALATAQTNLDTKQEALDKLQKELTAELDAIDLQRDRWVQAQNAIDLARVKSDAFAASMEYNVSLVEQLVAAWNSMGSGGVLGNSLSGSTGNGVGSTSYVAPTTTAADEAIAAQFDSIVSELDSALAAMDSQSTGGQRADAEYEAKVARLAKAQAEYDAFVNAGIDPNSTSGGGGKPGFAYMATGGFVAKGTDTVPAMLTPGEFVVNRASAQKFGSLLSEINSPTYQTGGSSSRVPAGIISSTSVNNNNSSVYNYSVGITVGGSSSSPDDIARAVMTQIQYVDSQRIKGQR
jgi:TP901 family phage tail tape measure protein